MLRRVSARELRDWELYYLVEPWGEWRADYRMAILASVDANIHRGKDSKAYEPKDFMPEFERRPEPTPAEFTLFMEQLNAAFGGQDLRSQRKNGA